MYACHPLSIHAITSPCVSVDTKPVWMAVCGKSTFSFFRSCHQSTTFIASSCILWSERLLIKFTRMAPEKCVSVFSNPSCVIFSVASSQRFCVVSIFPVQSCKISRRQSPGMIVLVRHSHHRLNVCSLDVLVVVFCNHGVSKQGC